MLCDLQEVDAEWAARLEEAHAAAAAAKDRVRRELDAQIEAITRRLNELSSAEARRERRRTELAEKVSYSLLNSDLKRA
jgi:ppGpp synthetase/RelA/SpoT-type nucleotidyltranferase